MTVDCPDVICQMELYYFRLIECNIYIRSIFYIYTLLRKSGINITRRSENLYD